MNLHTGLKRSGISWDIFLIACLGLSLSINVILGWKIKRLGAISAPSIQAHIGMSVPSLRVKTTSGKTHELSLSNNRPSILYIFRPGCRWCAANLENIRSLSLHEQTTTDFFGLSTSPDGLDEYLKKNPLPFPIYIVDDSSELKSVDFVGTPQTIEISPDKKVIHNWVGAYASGVATSIEQRFHIKLPGLFVTHG